ncbi:MAG: cyclase family protein [Clostridiaceae bacterium]|nr:cyclase family protein [Clostridiaceae bacterium]
MNWIDLSLPISKDMPVYPGDPAVDLSVFLTHEHDQVQATALTMSCHAGTHLDAPRHFIPSGLTVDQIPPDWLSGPAFITSLPWRPGYHLDLRAADLSGYQDGDILLLATGWDSRAGSPLFYQDIPLFASGSAQFLLSKGVRVFGLDLPTIVEAAEPPRPSAMHQSLLGAGLIVIESLAHLTELGGQRVDFMALPLRLAGCEGSPVRAVARKIAL